jgi:ferredoxin
MRIFVDQDRCEGHGQCVAAAPEIFEFDDDGLTVVVQDPVGPAAEEAARAAARRCPVAALHIEELRG